LQALEKIALDVVGEGKAPNGDGAVLVRSVKDSPLI
jgi:hypothetical protein